MATVAFETRTTTRKKARWNLLGFRVCYLGCMQLRRKYYLAESCLILTLIPVMFCGAVATAERTKGTNTGPGRGRISFWGSENALAIRRESTWRCGGTEQLGQLGIFNVDGFHLILMRKCCYGCWFHSIRFIL
jgi:hypothetical protein